MTQVIIMNVLQIHFQKSEPAGRSLGKITTSDNKNTKNESRMQLPFFFHPQLLDEVASAKSVTIHAYADAL